ncbi:hypothetical protein BDR22DRAFT_781038, partial [Usnea florida]
YYSDSELLNGRGWTLQERILSPRILIYSSWQLQWQCQSHVRSDYNIPEETGNKPWIKWIDLFNEYSKRALTELLDKLPALADIASRYQNDTKDIYCAGLWKTDLLKGLKWYIRELANHRPSVYRTPTWLWASVLGEIIWMDDKLLVKNKVAVSTVILDCHVTPEEPLASLGKVSQGTLTING